MQIFTNGGNGLVEVTGAEVPAVVIRRTAKAGMDRFVPIQPNAIATTALLRDGTNLADFSTDDADGSFIVYWVRELDNVRAADTAIGYALRPAVGGSITLGIIGAYVLAGELARAGWRLRACLPAYERAMAERIRGSRACALSAAKTLIPTSRRSAQGLAYGASRPRPHVPTPP
ncbi:hypothetical protein [Amycolatopsis rubida]|uniref:Uncharacterized protein n=1 Tax=Amycolatopsis rubida TaxID=112413 RepID=A0A1I5ZCP3_9PSEU|nr:hypothetical protein [Amycolatopsis rubida]SFQ54168.1 hypothetical protein SAMN05421854_114206 [Amycolatopsis rubida]